MPRDAARQESPTFTSGGRGSQLVYHYYDDVAFDNGDAWVQLGRRLAGDGPGPRPRARRAGPAGRLTAQLIAGP